jgi:hypothetical protein
MKTNPILDVPEISVQNELPDLKKSSNELNFWDGRRVKKAVSKGKGNAIIDVETTRVQAQADLGCLNIQIATQQAKQALLNANVHISGVLLARLDSAMATVDKTLSNTQASAMFIHEKNYQETCASFRQLDLSDEQFESFDAVLNHNKVSDQRRAQERMEKSKKSLEDLHTATVQGVNVFKKII